MSSDNSCPSSSLSPPRVPHLLVEQSGKAASLRSPRTSIEYKFSFAEMTPSQKLIFQLNRNFPDQDMRELEEMAEEIQQQMAVQRLNTFARIVRSIGKEYAYAMSLSDAKKIDEALRDFENNFILVNSSEEGPSRRSSILKPCLKTTEKGVVTQSEKLVAEISYFLNEEEIMDIEDHMELATSKDEVKEVIAYLSTVLRARAEETAHRRKQATNEAVQDFVDEIRATEKDFKKVNNFIETMRKMSNEILKDISNETSSEIYTCSKRIMAEFNSSNDKVTENIVNETNSILNLLHKIKNDMPEKSTLLKKINNFEESAKTIIKNEHADEN